MVQKLMHSSDEIAHDHQLSVDYFHISPQLFPLRTVIVSFADEVLTQTQMIEQLGSCQQQSPPESLPSVFLLMSDR